jgi:hypothetical protein
MMNGWVVDFVDGYKIYSIIRTVSLLSIYYTGLIGTVLITYSYCGLAPPFSVMCTILNTAEKDKTIIPKSP